LANLANEIILSCFVDPTGLEPVAFRTRLPRW